ncbi:MAG: SPOR domain-containing protein [Gammaproteobacteria bacterium]|nr:MAG: SPOR domain-containing protein [Gammaproteobacteria bacterium]
MAPHYIDYTKMPWVRQSGLIRRLKLALFVVCLVGLGTLTALYLTQEPDILKMNTIIPRPPKPFRIAVQPAPAPKPSAFKRQAQALTDMEILKEIEFVKIVGLDNFSLPSSPQRMPKVSDPVAWVLQVGSFADIRRADTLRKQLMKRGYAAYIEKVPTQKHYYFRVRVGPEVDRMLAEKKVSRIADQFKIRAFLVPLG